MEITLTFGLSFSLKHSFQTQLYNHSRRSWLNIADVCFSLFDTISLSDWITLYCLSLLDMNFTRWLIYTPLFFTLLLSKVTKYPGSKEQISRSRLSKSEHCPQGKNSKTHVCVSLPRVHVNEKTTASRGTNQRVVFVHVLLNWYSFLIHYLPFKNFAVSCCFSITQAPNTAEITFKFVFSCFFTALYSHWKSELI